MSVDLGSHLSRADSDGRNNSADTNGQPPLVLSMIGAAIFNSEPNKTYKYTWYTIIALLQKTSDNQLVTILLFDTD